MLGLVGLIKYSKPLLVRSITEGSQFARSKYEPIFLTKKRIGFYTSLSSISIEFRPFLPGSISVSGRDVLGIINLSIAPLLQNSVAEGGEKKRMKDFSKKALFRLNTEKILSIFAFGKDFPKLSFENNFQEQIKQSIEFNANEEGDVSIKIENSNSLKEAQSQEITIKSCEFIFFQLMAEYLFPYMVGWSESETIKQQKPSLDPREERKSFTKRKDFNESQKKMPDNFSRNEFLESP